jgi:hypothetical protein
LINRIIRVRSEKIYNQMFKFIWKIYKKNLECAIYCKIWWKWWTGNFQWYYCWL